MIPVTVKIFLYGKISHKIRLILSKCANIMRTSGRNVVLTMMFS